MFIDLRCIYSLSSVRSGIYARPDVALTELGSITHRISINIALLRSGEICVDANDARSWHLNQSWLVRFSFLLNRHCALDQRDDFSRHLHC